MSGKGRSDEASGTAWNAEGSESLPSLLDERSQTNFRNAFGTFACRSTAIDSAVAQIRLTGLDLKATEIQDVIRLRVLLAEVNAVKLRREAEAVLSDTERSQNLMRLISGMERGIIHVRAAPLAGWHPDFSIFSWNERPQILMVGLHWFQQPYPHQGPVLSSVHGSSGAQMASERFDSIWSDAYDVGSAILDVFDAAMRRIPAKTEKVSTL